ncbi:MAG: DEAD/DEAH box helicase [Saccharofermentanales bacterium]|jgi:ATP-dependent RNA helicase DeaD|nr:DEAD/DEAH box helicase [Bacillota bacterium]NLB09191.1 DEAD/DEAH box helicase [Clostridiales bacterium]
MTDNNKKITSFRELGLSDLTLDVLNRMGITVPTSVQQQAIPPMMRWYDVMAKAPTGTGKTLAFGIPIIEHIEKHRRALQALILSPTRELALQIGQDLSGFAVNRPWIEVAVLYGGQPIRTQIEALRRKPQIAVATPGRLIDLLRRRSLRLDEVEIAILDEADRMLDMGFIKDVRFILDKMPRVSQIALFSATFSREVMDISYLYQREPVEIRVEEIGQDKPDIKEYLLPANGAERITAIRKILSLADVKRGIVFVNMKQSADMVVKKLRHLKINAAAIHGDIRQQQRERVLSNFRKGNLRILVATDVASRGLDIENVDIVFNYDLPLENENYIHRIGRTGRAGKSGIAVTFLSPGGEDRLDTIAQMTGAQLEEITDLDTFTF